jgi:hypothetical protein
LAKFDTGPRSTVIFDLPVGVPMRLLSTAISLSSNDGDGLVSAIPARLP